MQTNATQDVVSYNERGVFELHDPRLLEAVSGGLTYRLENNGTDQGCGGIDSNCQGSNNHCVDANGICASDIACSDGSINQAC